MRRIFRLNRVASSVLTQYLGTVQSFAMPTYGYARVSTIDQDLSLQRRRFCDPLALAEKKILIVPNSGHWIQQLRAPGRSKRRNT